MKHFLVFILSIIFIQSAYANSNKNCKIFTNTEITMCLPENWEVIPQNEIDDYQATVVEATGGRAPQIKYAFQEKNEDSFVYPYIIINPTLDADLSKTFKDDPNKLINGISTSITELKTTALISGTPTYSKAENTVWIRIDNENIDGDKIVSITGLHLKSKGLISVAIHSSSTDYNAQEQTYLAMIKSVKFK